MRNNTLTTSAVSIGALVIAATAAGQTAAPRPDWAAYFAPLLQRLSNGRSSAMPRAGFWDGKPFDFTAANARRAARTAAALPHYQSAEAFFRKGDWSASTGECRAAIDVGDSAYRKLSRYLLGRTYLAQERFEEAKAELGPLHYDPKGSFSTAPFRGDLALALYKTGELKGIEALLKDEIRLYYGDCWSDFDANLPGFGNSAQIGASVYLVRGQCRLYNYMWIDEPMDYKGAVDELYKADALVPGNALINCRLGEGLMKLKRYVEAERCLLVAQEKGKGFLREAVKILLNEASWYAKLEREAAGK